MKNPLVLFVGAAVVAVAALAGATADRWQDWPGPVPPVPTAATSPDDVSVEAAEPLAEPLDKSGGEPESKLPPPATDTAEPPPELRREQPAEAETGPAPREPVAADGVEDIESPTDVQSAEEVQSPDVAEGPMEEPAVTPEEPTEELMSERAEPERLAAVEPREALPAATAAPDAEPEPAQPRFDVVRVAEDGSLVVAGLAAPGAEVTLLLDGEAIASDAANDFGAWLLMPDAPLPPGSHQLMVEARDAGSGAQSSGTIAVAVPDRAAGRPRVAQSEPAPGVADIEEPARLEPEDQGSGDAEEEQVALAPVQEPAEDEQSVEIEETAEIDEPVAEEAEPQEQAALAPVPEVESEDEPEPRDIPLALEAIDYNDDGEIVFSGRATAGGVVRIHVDNRFVGETIVDVDGRWAFAGGSRIAPGRHTLRADLIGADGNVVGRIILPFVRADGREVAALVESRRDAAAQPEPEPEPPAMADEIEPEPELEAPEAAEEAAPVREPEAPAVADVSPEPELEAPVVAEEIAPEPEPETPVVADEVAPEPEPETPVVAEEVAPEPEAEAPVVAEEAAPEPEAEVPVVAEEAAPEPEAPVAEDDAPEPDAEAPVVAEEVAPEPDAEAPVVAEEVAPEPEVEAPVVAEEVAPEQEPEAPVVAEEVLPEPEPEAPVVAEEVAPEPEARVAAVEQPDVQEPEVGTGEPEAAARPGHVVIQPGNNLWRISRVIYGRGIEYTAIYEANRDKIRDPDLIYPGQILATPGVDPPMEIDPERREPLSPEELARQNGAE